jgi:aspartate/methionine/tyrosine aminotransferase
MQSDYMHWAKTRQQAPFTLAISGIQPIALEELGASWSDLALEPPAGYGWPPLSVRIAERYGVTPECVVTAAGTSGANHLAMAALIEAGDEVVCETPGYEPMLTLAAHLGGRLRPVARRADHGFALDAGAVASAITSGTRLVVLSNLHNPSSAATDAATLRAVGDAAARVGAHVLVDEVYLDSAFEAAPASAALLGEPFLITSSLTKVYGISGLRAGWIVAPPALAGRLWQLKNLFGVNDAHPAERLALVALGRLNVFAARARAILDVNRAAWNAWLAAHREDLDAPPSTVGTTAFPRVVHGDGDMLERVLRDRFDTTVVPGRFFGAPGHVRVGLCGDPEGFEAGLARLSSALESLRERRG